jgi:hypothetical protein
VGKKKSACSARSRKTIRDAKNANDGRGQGPKSKKEPARFGREWRTFFFRAGPAFGIALSDLVGTFPRELKMGGRGSG